MKLKTGISRIFRNLASLTIVGAFLLVLLPAAATGYVQNNLVSDVPGLARFTDPNLVNPWGIASSTTSPFWVSNNGTGLATLYDGAGVKQNLEVTIPPPPGSPPGTLGTPTGVVFNANSGNFMSDRFIFATEGGTIAGWQGSLGTTAAIRVDMNATGAVYKGLAIGNSGTPRLYATDFNNAKVDIFDSNFQPVFLPNAFTDPNLPSGFAPFGIQNLGGKLYVTYALKNPATNDDVAGPGNGLVDVFDLNGSLVKRLVTQGALNSPWGLAMAPTTFGEFGGDLLVGNFGDGRINAFDLATSAFIGTLKDSLGNDIINEGLWGLIFGNGGNGGDLDKLYFTAGIPGSGEIEDHGLFGSIAVPLPSTVMLLGSGLAGLLTFSRVRKRRA